MPRLPFRRPCPPDRASHEPARPRLGAPRSATRASLSCAHLDTGQPASFPLGFARWRSSVLLHSWTATRSPCSSTTSATSAPPRFRSRPAKPASRWPARGASPTDPLPLLLESYERFGPVFTLRLFHGNVVFMLGPAANHYITVSHASNFIWRDSHFRDLIGLMGDGLLTIDGEFHRRSRLIMLPAFHHDHIAASVESIVEETTRALDRFTPGATHRPLRLDPPARPARGHARAVRPRPRRRARPLDRRRRPVRAGPLLLLLRLPPAHAARPRSRPGPVCSRPRASSTR